MPGKDKNFGGSLVLDIRTGCHVKIEWRKRGTKERGGRLPRAPKSFCQEFPKQKTLINYGLSKYLEL